MLTGAFLGALIVVLFFIAFFLFAQNRAFAGQIKAGAKELAAADANLRTLAAQVQKNENIPYVVNFTEEQITFIANRVSTRVQTMLDAANEAALNKLN